MDVKGEDFQVTFDESTASLKCIGTLRLLGAEEYAPIEALFNSVLDSNPTVLVLDVTELQFLNSSGINIISRLVIKIRNLKTIQLTVKGRLKYPWQSKSLSNLKKLMPALEVQMLDGE